jgi:hypothetical protein
MRLPQPVVVRPNCVYHMPIHGVLMGVTDAHEIRADQVLYDAHPGLPFLIEGLLMITVGGLLFLPGRRRLIRGSGVRQQIGPQRSAE